MTVQIETELDASPTEEQIGGVGDGSESVPFEFVPSMGLLSLDLELVVSTAFARVPDLPTAPATPITSTHATTTTSVSVWMCSPVE